MTDPDQNTTHYRYDEAGQLAVTTGPVISTQTYGQQATQAPLVTMTGYDTFGDPAESEDARGKETVTTYDGEGRPVSVTEPSYTPPDGSATITGAQSVTEYNGLGQVISQTDPLHNKMTFSYDQLGDLTSQTAPDGGVTAYAYDDDGDQLSATSPTGGVTDSTYDFLGRQVTSTQAERYPSPASYTTQTSYGPGGSSPWPVSQTTPDLVTTTQAYDAAGDPVSVTDGAGNTTTQAYDAAGRPTTVTNPDGTYSTSSYDEAGRRTGEADYSASGTQLRSDSASYDADGNQLSATDYRGSTSTFGYSAADELTSETQPVTSSSAITTSFGYDPDGNPTLYTDGNGSDWWSTWNSWNLPESTIEPSTASVFSRRQLVGIDADLPAHPACPASAGAAVPAPGQSAEAI